MVRRVDIKAEAEVNVKRRIGKLLVVVGRQTANSLVLAREKELAALERRQAKERHIVGVYP